MFSCAADEAAQIRNVIARFKKRVIVSVILRAKLPIRMQWDVMNISGIFAISTDFWIISLMGNRPNFVQNFNEI